MLQVRDEVDPEYLEESEDEYLDRASEQKFAPALQDRAETSANMSESDADNDLPFKYWRRAVIQDYTPSVMELANCFAEGIGCEKDTLLASCLEKLAEIRGVLEAVRIDKQKPDDLEFARILVKPNNVEPRASEALKALRACKDQKVFKFLYKRSPIYGATKRPKSTTKNSKRRRTTPE